MALPAEPTLLMTAQRLRRLKRDRQRQTVRWTNFESRVKSAPDSRERGFELALYFLITGEEAAKSEALQWSHDHPCELRQRTLIADWTATELPAAGQCPSKPDSSRGVIAAQRDDLLLELAATDITEERWQQAGSRLSKELEEGAYHRGPDLYAAAEALAALKSARPRFTLDSPFLKNLPLLVLLDRKPAEIENPDTDTHLAALALVSIDPNSEATQFLQGWALEDRHQVHEGPGLAYELLWADPYLPGVGYQNLEPWLFDDRTGLLVARTNWQPDACWIHVDDKSMTSDQCPPGWQKQPVMFGHLRLQPFTGKCNDVEHQPSTQMIVSQLSPGQRLRFPEAGQKDQIAEVTPTGLWRVPLNASRVCLAR